MGGTAMLYMDFRVHRLSRHSYNPSEEHLKLAKHCIKHLLLDINKGIKFHGSATCRHDGGVSR